MTRMRQTLGADWILRVPPSYIAREGRWSCAASLSLEVLDSLAAQS